jgi:hypothetical protein
MAPPGKQDTTYNDWQGTPAPLWTPAPVGGSTSNAYYTQISNTTTPATYTSASNINLTTGETDAL